MASNSHVNSPIYPKIKLIQDFTAVLNTCKSDEDSIKNEISIVQDNIFRSLEWGGGGGRGGGGGGGGRGGGGEGRGGGGGGRGGLKGG